MNSVGPELTWKPCAKGRRSRKSVARTFGSPKRLMGTLVSGSDKVDASGRGRATSRRKEKASIKKRRQLDQRSSSMKLDSPTAFSEENEQPLYPCYSSEDLYGIELLATVASMEGDFVNAGLEDLPESSLALRCSDAATFTSHSKELPVRSTHMCDKTLLGSNSGCALVLPEPAACIETLCRSPNENNMYKVNRQHWDLNIQMDAWVEPFDSNVNGLPFEEKQKDSEDQLLPKPIGKTDECPNPRTEDSESAVGLDRIHCQLRCRKEHMHSFSSYAGECPDRITRDDVHEKSTNQVLGCESSLETAKQVKVTEATIDRSHIHKVDCYGMLMEDDQFVESTGTAVDLQDEVFLSNMILCPVDRVYRSNQDITFCDLPTIEVSEHMIGTQCNDSKDSVMASGRSHTTISAENVTPCTSHSDNNENNSNEGKLLQIPKQLRNDETNDEVKESIMSGARAQCADPSICVENNDLAFTDIPYYDQGHMVGDDVTRHVEMYDSSYEDGELRGSFLYSWEDNALENESVDYESDGRNVDGSSADEHAGYEVLEGGSEASHGSETRNLKKSDSVTRSLRRFVNGDPGNNDVSGKVESNAGSGSTVEHCFEFINEENDHCMKRRHLSDRREVVVGKSIDSDGYPLKLAARQSYINSLDRRNPYSIQRCRSHRDSGSFSRTTKEVTPERYQGRRRPISFNERDGVDKWTPWASKKRFNLRYQGAEGHGYSRPRSTVSNSSEFYRLDDVDHRKAANNMSTSYHNKPFMRKSPLDKDDSLGIRRTPFGRGTSRYKSRGCYSQRASRDLGEHFEPPPEHDATHVTRLPRYSLKREHSFSSKHSADARFNKRLRRSHSRSRTPTRVWQPHRDQSLYTLKHSRSQDFGYKFRAGRVRVPFPRSAFASEYEDNYSSPSVRRFSPIHRLVDDHGPVGAENSILHRRSTDRYLRRTSKFETMGSGGKDAHYPVRKLPFKSTSGREAKLESTSDDNGEAKRRDNGGNVQRFRTNGARDLEMT